MTAALADDARQFTLAVAEFVDQPAIAGGLFQGGQVGALDVLDQADLQGLAIAALEDDDRHLVDLGGLGGAPAALTGDDLEGARIPAVRAHD